jgi:hypothetical protein
MNPQDQIPSLHAIAVQMLPGMRQARALLDVSVHVLEYFERHAEYEATTGKPAPFELADRARVEEVEQLRSMLNAFRRLHGLPS